MLNVINLHGGPYSANSFLVFDDVSKEAALFDPAVSTDSFAEATEKMGLSLKYLVLTHGHYDHMVTLNDFRAQYPDAVTAISIEDAICFEDPIRSCASFFSVPEFRSAKPEMILSEGSILTLGKEEIKVIATPGHTPGCLCFIFGEEMITGDTLFRDSIGRSDLPGGNSSVLFDTLARLVSLDTDYVIYPGHGDNTTLSRERKFNPFLREIK